MSVDIRQLSPKAQAQVLRKLQETNRRGAGATSIPGEGKFSRETGSAQSGSKYGNKKVDVDGITFDSKKEMRRWLELDAMAKAGEISDLQRQVSFELIPSQRIDGKVVERSCGYIADFCYRDKGGSLVVEDVKGYRNPNSAGYAKFVIKRKLMLWIHGIRIREV